MCELRYDKQIDLKNVNLKKLKVRDLKKILNDWDETVRTGLKGCLVDPRALSLVFLDMKMQLNAALNQSC